MKSLNRSQDFSNIKTLSKIATGIEGFEHISMGGLTEGRTTLIVGSSGSGKTMFAVEFLYRGITTFNRNGVFITFEERPREIVRNVKTLGWDLGKLVKQKRLIFLDASPEPEHVEETGSYDLSGLVVQIKHAIEKVGAKLLVMDSIGSLFDQFTNTGLIRQEIFRITDIFKDMGITAIITAERLQEYGTISRYGIEEFVSDNVIIIRNVLEEEKCRRTIQVLKVRGNTHYKGEFPFTITDSGINIIPLSAMELKQSSSTQRISFGNAKLDEMTNGGLFQDSITLASGPTGSGKTLLCATFTAEACKKGEKILLLAFEESRAQLIRNATGWNVDFQNWEKAGLLKIICHYPEAMGLEDHLLNIRRAVAEFKPRRLIMDSVSAMERVANVRLFREFVIGLTSFVKQEEICSLFTSTTPKLSGGDSITEAHISTITDAIILMRYVEINGILRRGIAVIKMRGSQHDKQVREFTIDGKGLHIGEPFKNVHNIILGIATHGGLSESEHLDEMFEH